MSGPAGDHEGVEALEGFLDRVASPDPLPAGGAAAAATAALAAALLAQIAGRRSADELVAEADRLRRRASALITEDVAAYRAALEVSRHAGSDSEAARTALSAAADPPAAVAEVAADIAELARTVSVEVEGALRSDAAVAGRLAVAASASAAALVRANLDADGDARVGSAGAAVQRAERAHDELTATLR